MTDTRRRNDRIALIGEKGSGKTSIGNAWIDIVNGQRLSFAFALKWEVAFALAAADIQKTVLEPSLVMSSRDIGQSLTERAFYHYGRMADVATKDAYTRILQLWGTDFRRASDPFYWVKPLLAQLNITPGPIVIDDTRFDNEHEALVAAGFVFIRLEDGETIRDQGAVAAAHASEVDWHKWPVDISLSFKRGPELQAQRLIAEFGLYGGPLNDA